MSFEDLLLNAVRKRDLETCKKLLNEGHKWTDDHWITVGYEADVKFAEAIFPIVGGSTNVWIAPSSGWAGSLDLLIWMKNKGFPITRHCHESAARANKLEVLKWLHKIMPIPEGEEVCEWAATNKDPLLLKWAHQNGYHWDEQTTYDAANHGRLENLMYAHENGCPWNERCFSIKPNSEKARKKVIQYLISEKCPGWKKEKKKEKDE